MKRINYVSALTESFLETRRYHKNLRQKHDIVLDPYISLDITTNSNWARSYLQVDDYTASQPIYKRKAVVFILDTAGEIKHPDLVDRVANQHGADFTGEGKADGNGHGTGCASCYVGKQNGVGPRDYITIVPVKVLRNNGSGSYSAVLQGMKYAYDTWKNQYPDYVGVISMSLGGGAGYTPMKTFAEQARAAGMWIAASSGNSGFSPDINRVGYPAKYDAVWAMGAIDSSGEIASFSSGGDELVFAGPGRNVNIAWKNNSYITANGTSFGMPYAQAALLHMACQYPQLTTMEKAEDYYKKYAKDLYTPGKDKGTGYGCPVLSPFIGQIPDDKPTENPPPPPPPPEEEPPQEPPSDDPTEEPRTTERTLQFTFQSNKYYMNWEQQGYPTKHRVFIPEITVELKTKALATDIYDRLEKALEWYFTSRGIIMAIDRAKKSDKQIESLITETEAKIKGPSVLFLPFAGKSYEKDFADAGYWAGRFAEVLIKKSRGLAIKVKSLTAKDEKGRKTNIII